MFNHTEMQSQLRQRRRRRRAGGGGEVGRRSTQVGSPPPLAPPPPSPWMCSPSPDALSPYPYPHLSPYPYPQSLTQARAPALTPVQVGDSPLQGRPACSLPALPALCPLQVACPAAIAARLQPPLDSHKSTVSSRRRRGPGWLASGCSASDGWGASPALRQRAGCRHARPCSHAGLPRVRQSVGRSASPREAAPDPSPRRHHRSLADTPPLLLSDDCLPG